MSFQEIFGQARSALERHADDDIAYTLCALLDQAWSIDPQQCLDALCPYIREAISRREVMPDERFVDSPGALTWEHHIPKLILIDVHKYSEHTSAERIGAFYEHCPDLRYSMLINAPDLPSLIDCDDAPWRDQLGSLSIFHGDRALALSQLIGHRPPWRGLHDLWLDASLSQFVIQDIVESSLCLHVKRCGIAGDEETPHHTFNLYSDDVLPALESLILLEIPSSGALLQMLITPTNRHTLKTLTIEGGRLHRDQAEYVFHGPMPRLHDLSIELHEDVGNATQTIINHLDASALNILRLDNSLNHTIIAPLDLTNIYDCPLQALYITAHQLKDQRAVQGPNTWRGTLQTLNLNGCGLTDEVFAGVLQRLGPALEALYLNDNHISLLTIDALKQHPALQPKHLQLARTTLDDRALEHLTSWLALSSLQHLNIQGTATTTEGLARLRASPSCPETLNITHH